MKSLPKEAPEAAEGAIRQDTRKHTKHCLRPTQELVERYQANNCTWDEFADEYGALLNARFSEDCRAFDELARLAMEGDVFLGCSCPTQQNPDVTHCHTVLALRFMQEHYPLLTIKLPIA
ncbi:DUF488 family protein, N3 subclade [Bythopirellula goksoeyrii]|nr:hypothetical protein [Bythopirellula goksoeyrii]